MQHLLQIFYECLYELKVKKVISQVQQHVMIKDRVWSIESFIAYGQASEFPVTVGRGELHIIWNETHIDHKTSL